LDNISPGAEWSTTHSQSRKRTGSIRKSPHNRAHSICLGMVIHFQFSDFSVALPSGEVSLYSFAGSTILFNAGSGRKALSSLRQSHRNLWRREKAYDDSLSVSGRCGSATTNATVRLASVAPVKETAEISASLGLAEISRHNSSMISTSYGLRNRKVYKVVWKNRAIHLIVAVHDA